MGNSFPPEPEVPGPNWFTDWWKILWLRRSWVALALTFAAVVLIWKLVDDGDGYANDHLQVDNAPAGAVPVSLVDGLRGSTCLVDEAFKGSGLIDLGGKMSAAGCPSEVVTFSTGRAVELEPGPVWSGSATAPLVMLLKDPVKLSIVQYVPADNSIALTEAIDQPALADDLYDQNLVGIRFARETPVSFDAADAVVIGDGCSSAGSLATQGPALGRYDPAAINVYYVELVDGFNANFGYNCEADGYPNIIYISTAYGIDNTLAHELGHALALRGKCDKSSTSSSFGHVNAGCFPASKFDKHNLMWAYLDSATTRRQDHFTLGQAYRMNIETSSWANKAGARTDDAKDCGAAPLESHPCLPLDFDAP